MHYEINVAKAELDRNGEIKLYEGKPRYEHYFATQERSIGTSRKAKQVGEDLLKAFPSPMFNITITKWETVGERIDINTL